MQVKITKEAKKWLTVAEMPIVRQIIADLKDDESTAAEYAKQAANAIFFVKYGRFLNYKARVFEASAEIAGNQNVNDYYSENSGHLDVWINFVIFDELEGTISGGAYLSDIWSLTADNKPEIVKNMFYQIYTLTKSSY